MKKYYLHGKSHIILGFMVLMPFIVTELISGYLWWKILTVIRFGWGWIPKSTFDTHWKYYFYALGSELLGLYLIGLLIAPYDDWLDSQIKKIPLIGLIYSRINDMFTTKKTPQGVPIDLPIYNSSLGGVTCLIPSFKKRWKWVEQRDRYCWCVTIVPLPNVNPIGGHNQHWPWDYIEEQLKKQYAGMEVNELLTYCISIGVVFPERLTQQKDEEMPLFLLEKQKEIIELKNQST